MTKLNRKFRPRVLEHRPTWHEARHFSEDAEQWNQIAAVCNPADIIPEPTTLGVWLELQVGWVTHHFKHWRCWFFGHIFTPWRFNHDYTAAYADCQRCLCQIGRGEY